MTPPKPISRLEKTLNMASMVISGIAMGLGLNTAGMPLLRAAGLAMGVVVPAMYIYSAVKTEPAGKKPSITGGTGFPEGVSRNRGGLRSLRSLLQAFQKSSRRNPVAAVTVKAAVDKNPPRAAFDATFKF